MERLLGNKTDQGNTKWITNVVWFKDEDETVEETVEEIDDDNDDDSDNDSDVESDL